MRRRISIAALASARCPRRRRADPGAAGRRARRRQPPARASPPGPASAATAATHHHRERRRRTGEWESDCALAPCGSRSGSAAAGCRTRNTYVGGRWRPGRRRTTDLGTVPGAAGGGRPARAGRARAGRTPTSWSPPPPWPTAPSSGPTCSGWRAAPTCRSRPGGRRSSGWARRRARRPRAGSTRSPATSGGELEVRKQAVFALSQRPADEGVPALIRDRAHQPASRAPEDRRSSGWARARIRGRFSCSRRSCGSKWSSLRGQR